MHSESERIIESLRNVLSRPVLREIVAYSYLVWCCIWCYCFCYAADLSAADDDDNANAVRIQIQITLFFPEIVHNNYMGIYKMNHRIT